MASTVAQNTFLSTYNDDYRDSDHYHRILFNNGRPLQARELTQMQTIMQSELARLAEYIFKEGAIFDTNYGALSTGFQSLSFLKVLSLPTGYDLLVGNILTNPDGVTALVKAVIPATSTDPATILVRFLSSNNTESTDTATSPRVFRAADILSYDTGDISGTLTMQTTNTAGNPAFGKGSFIEIPQFSSFVHGHLVMAEAQSLVINKYSSTPTAVVGFKVTEQIITATDNIALYDNSGSTPNLTSPGADRYKISLTLSLESDIAATDTFHPLIKLNKGIVTALKTRDNTLNELGTVLAGRTDDIAGNFVVNDALQRFELEVVDDSDANYLQYNVKSGIAFIGGHRIERSGKIPPVRVLKPRNDPDDIEEVTNEFISASYGNYFLADTMKGLIGKVQNLTKVNLYNQPFNSSGTQPVTVNLAEVSIELSKHNVGLNSKFTTVFDTLDGSGYKYGDVDNSGTITSTDVLAVAAYAEGIDSDSLVSYFDSATNLAIAGRIKSNLQQNSIIERAYSSDAIGTARIRNVDEYDNEYRIHSFDIVMDSDGNGYTYGIKDIRAIGDTNVTSDNYANLTTVDGKYDLQDRANNNLLFPLLRSRVHETSNVTMSVRRIYTDTTNASGVATFSTGSSNAFTDQEQWIVAVDSSGAIFSPPTISGTPTTSATVTGLPTNSAVTMLAYERKTAVRKTKTLQRNQTASSLTLTNGTFTLDKADIFRFKSVIDDATSENITYKFKFDNGQKDNFYTVGSGTLKQGVSAPSGTVTVNYEYFSHSAGDFFGGKASYPDVETDKVPIYTTSTGLSYRLSDVIDMRPIKNNTGTEFTGTGAVIEDIPRNGDTITVGTAKYWQPRVDLISLSPSGSIKVSQGETTFKLKLPTIPAGNMLLHTIGLLPYTFNKNEAFVQTSDNRGYKMTDIRRLDTRVSSLEQLTSFTLAEMQTSEINVEDPYDASIDRIKTGITGDTFNNNNQSEILDEDYRARINKATGSIGPIEYIRELPLSYDSDLSLGTVKKQTTVWPKYTEEVLINQSVASQAININSFDVGQHVGTGIVEPSVVNWTLRKEVVTDTDVGDSADVVSVNSQGNQLEPHGGVETSTVTAARVEGGYGRYDPL